jgi:tetratricopeptide (TPR) repeat protein
VNRISPWLAAAGATAICVALAVGTIQRNGEYESPLTLARLTVERRPHGRAHYVLANTLHERGRRIEAIGHYERAAEDFPLARFALGTELIANGNVAAGIEQLRAFVRLMPAHPAAFGAHQLMASALLDRGEYEEAATELEAVLRLDPGNERAQALLGEALMRGRKASEAAVHLEQAAAVHPGNVRIRELLGHALALQHRYAEAELMFRQVLQIDTTHAGARTALAELERLTSSR